MAFKKGQSGNPAGKPRGAKDKRTEIRELLRPHQGDIVEKVVELAKGGDTTAIRLVLERICPPLRAGDQPVSIALRGSTAMEKADEIVQSVCTGAISLEQGTRLMNMLSVCARIMEVDQLVERIAALERTLGEIVGSKDGSLLK